jgi:hypothetical protein
MRNRKEIKMSKEIVKSEATAPTPSVSMQDALLAIVQRTDIDPDRLEKFLDLQIKMENRQAEREFNEAFSEFQKECPIIKRTKRTEFTSKTTGTKTSYEYSPLDELVFVVKPILTKHGLSYSFDTSSGKDESKLYVDIKHKGGHKVRSELTYDTIHDDSRMNNSQRRKSAMTYAKRALLENALGVVTTGEDDDANRAIDNPVSQEQLDEIRSLIKLTKADTSKFMAFIQVEKLEDLSAYEAKNAIHALKEKRSQCLK